MITTYGTVKCHGDLREIHSTLRGDSDNVSNERLSAEEFWSHNDLCVGLSRSVSNICLALHTRQELDVLDEVGCTIASRLEVDAVPWARAR